MNYWQSLKNMNILYFTKPIRWGPALVVYVVVRDMQINAAKKDK